MKKILALVPLFLCAVPVHAFQCNECHSKNPAMVRMHEAVKGQNCFECHRVGEKLMGKGVPRNREAQMVRRLEEPLCTSCHKK